MALFLEGDDDVISEINMTPLIDVMLVLLIVFMVTLPVLQHAVKVALPRADSQVVDARPPHIDISIDSKGEASWDQQPVDAAALAMKLAAAGTQQPEPMLQLYADRNVRYESVADVMSAAQHAGLNKINFVTRAQQ